MGADETYPPAAEASNGGAHKATINIGGEECTTFDDVEHAKVRAAAGVADDFLAGFDWQKSLKPGGGKGGNLMGFTADRRYIVKEVNGTDHKMMCALAAAYSEHVLAPEGSLLAHMYAHVQRPSTKRRYLVMNNWLPKVEPDPAKATLCVYDLKGCADDKLMVDKGADLPAVHKRFSKPLMWCGHLVWTPEREAYYQGKLHARKATFPVTPTARDWLMQRIERDCAFCKAHKCVPRGRATLGARPCGVAGAPRGGGVR